MTQFGSRALDQLREVVRRVQGKKQNARGKPRRLHLEQQLGMVSPTATSAPAEGNLSGFGLLHTGGNQSPAVPNTRVAESLKNPCTAASVRNIYISNANWGTAMTFMSLVTGTLQSTLSTTSGTASCSISVSTAVTCNDLIRVRDWCLRPGMSLPQLSRVICVRPTGTTDWFVANGGCPCT